VIIAAILSITPFLTIIISDGVKNLDQKLFEVAKIYNFSFTKTLYIVILPQLYPVLFSAFRTGFSLCWKLTVVAEVFGVGNGIGYQINYAYHMYNSKMVFAWILSFATIMVLIDRVVF
jgi:NitT/TauT family transport system permease protein